MKLTKGLLGLGALLIASQVNAATVSLTPASNIVSLGDSFTLTVGGTDFLNGATGGSVNLTWDANILAVETSTISLASGFNADGTAGGTLFWNSIGGATLAPGTLDISATLENSDLFGNPFPEVGPSFDFLSLSFTVIGAPAVNPSDVVIFQGSGGSWQNGLNQDETGVIYEAATVTVNAVADGDLSADGLVDVVDVLLSQQILTGQLVPTQDQKDHGDVAPLVNGIPVPDGLFNLGDLVVIQRKALGLVNF